MPASPSRLDIAAAATLVARGGILAYPTEGVWGLGCDPANRDAVLRLLAIKQRPVDKGVILIAGDVAQLELVADWSRLDPSRRAAVQASWPGPNTWIVPARSHVPAWITGAHDSVAVRVTAQADVVRLCAAFHGPLVSTSANRAGAPAAVSYDTLDPALLTEIDGVLTGDTGGRRQPSTIRDAATGTILRA
ncbi:MULTISPECIES: L-threonylcarbamoyladenylate synthase [Luteimonas]|uniref:L-threonylcarbamoyladenylate synthase n=1 Tax=Luteimonas TaxID=83614 RepID=UPI000C7B6DAD|nr:MULTISPECIES: Sua5/YciO/YrdC/YwlC family protein [Luteimonas]